MAVNHHPPAELILDYASGNGSLALSAIVAGHAHFCAACQDQTAALNALGGAMLEHVEPECVSPSTLATIMKRLDTSPARERMQTGGFGVQEIVPSVARHLSGGKARSLKWRQVRRKIEEAKLFSSSDGTKLSVLRLQPGFVAPMHSHDGHEYTLVLSGGYSDAGRHFGPGDFDARDDTHNHQPIVDHKDGCVCVVALDAPIRLTGTFGRLVNPFLRI